MIAMFEDKKFWSGCVSLLDGKIEEVHSLEEAERVDFHHSLYFSLEALERMDTGESAFFFVKNGELNPGCRDEIPDWVAAEIKKQITFIKGNL